MTLSELRTRLKKRLNRDDCDDVLATEFIVEGLQRIQTDVKAPFMERLLIFPAGASLSIIPVPADFLKMIDLFVQNDGRSRGVEQGALYPLDKLDYRQLTAIPMNGPPEAYARLQSQFHIRGAVAAGLETHMLYYGGLSAFASDDDENEATAAAPTLCLYAALAFAGDHFGHKSADRWEAAYGGLRDSLRDAVVDADTSGGPMVVSPSH